MRVLVTGAAGFVGKSLCSHLIARGHEVIAVVHKASKHPIKGVMSTFCLGDICDGTDWSKSLIGVDVIVHLAARTHNFDKNHGDREALFYKINVEGTMKLAVSATEMGVRRFVYMSSVKAVGESSGEVPLNESCS